MAYQGYHGSQFHSKNKNREELDFEAAMAHSLQERDDDHEFQKLLRDSRLLSLETERLRILQEENEKHKIIVENELRSMRLHSSSDNSRTPEAGAASVKPRHPLSSQRYEACRDESHGKYGCKDEECRLRYWSNFDLNYVKPTVHEGNDYDGWKEWHKRNPSVRK